MDDILEDLIKFRREINSIIRDNLDNRAIVVILANLDVMVARLIDKYVVSDPQVVRKLRLVKDTDESENIFADTNS